MPAPGQTEALSRQIKLAALRLGFSHCGIAQAAELTEEARYLERWLAAGKHGQMGWLAQHFDLRIDPRKLVPGARSVISVLKNYAPAPETEAGAPLLAAPKLSRYAWGEDYHHVVRNRLKELLEELRSLAGTEVHGRGFVDSAPLLDKAWARRAGLGWLGKHTNLLRPGVGSWFFIGHLVVDIPLQYDDAFRTDHCGSCTRCIDACPTDALTPYEIDARKCISYLTIELKEDIPEEFHDKLAGWAFGCDICQEVCPWNRFSQSHQEPRFAPLDEFLSRQDEDWEALSQSRFYREMRRSPLSRIKLNKWLRNRRLARASMAQDANASETP